VCEIFAIFIFYFVLTRYDQPDFLIQAMGMMTIVIIIFLIPNRWIHMLFVSLCGTAGFFVFSYLYSGYSPLEFTSAAIYLFLTIVLCAASAWNADRHHFNEFKTRRELEHIGSIDYLTNTANRFKMEEEAKRWINFCHRQSFPLAVVFIDVDNLKIINDQYGHQVGDTVLSSLSTIIHNQLRCTDLLAAWGGDEFIILLPNILLEDAVHLTERVRDAIGKNSLIIGETVTCSFGVAAMRANSTFESLINEADNLMYESKIAGKNHVKWSE
jgi:diguanylate cyclase (GGDEF)-like protein